MFSRMFLEGLKQKLEKSIHYFSLTLNFILEDQSSKAVYSTKILLTFTQIIW